MRFILGIVVGSLLTVGVAYVHDAAEPGPATVAVVEDGTVPAAQGERMVNWTVVDRELRGVNVWVQGQWAWITSQLNRAG